MATSLQKISQLPPSIAPLDGNASIPATQGGTTYKFPGTDLVLPSYSLLTFSDIGYLTGARVLKAGAGIAFGLGVARELTISTAIGGGTSIVFGAKTVASLAATENNFNGGTWGGGANKSSLRLTPFAGGTSMTGIDASGLTDGQTIQLMNMSDVDNITLVHESGASTAANRFHLPLMADFTVVPGQIIYLVYEIETNRLRVNA